MTTHVIDVNDINGDVLEHWHVCSSACQFQGLVTIATSVSHPQFAGLEAHYAAGEQTAANGQTVQYGAWPGGCETDYDEWCAFCGVFMWHGAECECADRDHDRESLPGFGELVANYARQAV